MPSSRRALISVSDKTGVLDLARALITFDIEILSTGGTAAMLRSAGVPVTDIVVVNLYPFQQAIAKADLTLEEAVENIDIGGPTMVRAAAKNYPHVTVV